MATTAASKAAAEKEASYQPRLKKPATFDHLRKKEPLQETVEIVLSSEPVEALEQAQARLASAVDEKEKKTAQRLVNEARDAVYEVTYEVKFQALGRKGYDDLLAEYSPTDEQKEEHGEDLIWNPDTFPQALVQKSCIQPLMTPEEVEVIFNEWNGPEISQLFYAALRVNTSRRVAEVGKDSGGIGS